jgi:hypothetical protein
VTVDPGRRLFALLSPHRPAVAITSPLSLSTLPSSFTLLFLDDWITRAWASAAINARRAIYHCPSFCANTTRLQHALATPEYRHSVSQIIYPVTTNMAPKKTRGRKRQTKISFSPAPKSSPAKPAKPSPAKVANNTPLKLASSRGSKRALDISSSEDELQAVTGRNTRVGAPVRAKSNGMFGSSEIDVPSDDSSSSEESEAEKKVHIKEKSKAKPEIRKRQRSSSSVEVDDAPTITVKPRKRTRRSAPEVEDEDSEEEAALQQPNKRRRVVRRQSTPEEEPEHSPTPPRSTRRRLTRRPHTPEDDEDDEIPGNADEERAELKEELAFLKSSPPSDKGRLRQDRPKDKRQAALEALKKRRAGTQDPPSTPARKQRTVVESESESELEVIKEEPGSDLEMLDDEDGTEDDGDAEEDDERDANALDMFQEDNDDAGFIDDDPDALIGGPDEQMPIEFSSLSRAKPKDLFKYAVEWMVMKKIHPAFNSGDDIYQLTFRKLEDEVQGLANSKFTSSAWTPDFARAIRARPDFLLNEIHGAAKEFMAGHCEACNRRNHPASFELSLTGQPYNKDTLEPLETGSDSDSDSDSSDSDSSSLSADSSEAALNGETPAFNAAGERLPPESKIFTLGRTCKANAQVSHTLLHWRYHLYQWVKDYLEREHHMTAEKLVKREKKSDSKRAKEARKIVDRMESGGEIKKLHHLYKDQVRFALEAQNDYRLGWGRK